MLLPALLAPKTSVADANIGSIFGIGFPAWTGGVLQYVNQYEGGLQGFVDRARELAAAYGERLLERFGNPALHHRLLQIATDGSRKLLYTTSATHKQGSGYLTTTKGTGPHAIPVATLISVDAAGRFIRISLDDSVKAA